MNAGDETHDHPPQNPVERACQEVQQLDDLCERFELEWKAGHGRAVADYLSDIGLDVASVPPDLIPQLAKLEDWYRRQQIEAKPASPERFPSGTILTGRYRIVAPLGKGGMGEVYRAYDVDLCKDVALKFLPHHLAGNPAGRAQFHSEVRAAHEVSSDHVCRVHDVREHDGQPFLTMAYIDGEDLASLLKRIQRPTQETAAEYARQLCRGLAAIHDQKILHRDLKPQNIMIDGRGKVRITDFGLAGLIGSFAESRGAGTPLYQAPEQLAGGEPTIKSDIYALGLVLYELFTGKRAFAATTREELVRLQEAGLSRALSDVDLHPNVVAVILECVKLDPTARPSSANKVLYSLLSAGGTPSSEQTSDADPDAASEGSLSPRVSLSLFALALAGILLSAWLNDTAALFRQMPTDLSPRELTVRARGHLKQLGYEGPMADSANGIATDEPLLRHIRDNHPDLLRRDGLRSGQPAVMCFWYRQSPQPLAQRLGANDTSGWSMPGRVLPNEPPLREPGMTCVYLDLDGRLLELHAVPPHVHPDEVACEPDPKSLLVAAGFTEGSLRESKEFRHVPPVFADRQMAWEGAHPTTQALPVRVEAAFYRGKPVYFHVGPSGHSDRLPGFMPDNRMERFQEWKNMLLGLIALPFGGWFAWRNWKLRRANPRGASILAGGFVVLGLVGWLLAAKHVLVSADELSMFCGMLGRVLFDGFLLWLAYLALEPWVRQTSAWRVISWNRLLEGKWRNRLVGSDVLIGVVTAAGFVALVLLLRSLPRWFGLTPDPKLVWDATFTEGAGSLVLTVQIALMVALRYFFMFFLLLLFCRREWLAAVLVVIIWAVPYAHGGDYLPVRVVVCLIFALVNLLVLRVGLLAFIAFNLTEEVLIYMPVTTDFSAWYSGVSTLSLLLVASLAAYACWVACGQRSLDATEARA